MSSGNPFRASQLYNPAGASPVPPPSYVNVESSVPEARRGSSDHVLEDVSPSPPKTKKQVRIVSPTTSMPPHSADDDVYGPLRQDHAVERGTQDQYVGSPPTAALPGFVNRSAAQVGLTAKHTREDNNMAATGLAATSFLYTERPQTTMSPNGVPANPFSRTLASLEPQDIASADVRTIAEASTTGSSKAALDVESFKNLLMTGKPTPRPSAQSSQTMAAPNTLGGPQLESGSSTDTSSQSRQSVFETSQEMRQDTPRTSYEMAESDEDERMGLVSEVKKGKKKPPPAPKHRHGKLVTQRQPQVVSFDGFAATEPAKAATTPVTVLKDSSDVNKPLPPTPIISPRPISISSQETTMSSSKLPPIPPRSGNSSPFTETLIVQKRGPPPVPLARRQSQLRASVASNRSRSNSSLTISSQHSAEYVPSPAESTHDPSSSTKCPPPPPPSRHGARLQKSNTSTPGTEPPHRSLSARAAAPPPAAPSSRRSTLDLDSTPSPNSHTSRTLHISPRTVSSESTTSLPPPPPPRRRHQSQSTRSSLDHPRPRVSSPSSSSPPSRRTSTSTTTTTNTHHHAPPITPDASGPHNRRASLASERSLRREYAPAGSGGTDVYVAGEGDGDIDSDRKVSVEVQDDVETTPMTTVHGPATGSAQSESILDDMERFQREIEELRSRCG